MSQVVIDDCISVAIGPTKPITEKKMAQLADARVKAIDARKRRQKQRLGLWVICPTSSWPKCANCW
eukprot:7378388-Prymnesium_polylepis.2